MSIAVRRAEAADVVALASLRWTWRVDEVGEQPAGSGQQYLDSMREWWTTHPDHAAVLAEETDAGKGVGARLLALVAEIARTENRAYVAVHPSPRSTSLYQRCGYASSAGLRELRLDR